MACDAATIAQAVAANACGIDHRRSLLLLAGILYTMTGQDAETAMQGATCFSGMDDNSLALVILSQLCEVS